MNKLLEWVKRCKEVLAAIAFVVALAGGIIAVRTFAGDVSDLKKKSTQVDQAIIDIGKVAQQVQANQEAIWDWKTYLRSYLVTKGVKEETVKRWMAMPIGVDDLIVESDTLINVPFISRNGLPEIGTSCILRKTDSGVVTDTMKTLWNYTENK